MLSPSSYLDVFSHFVLKNSFNYPAVSNNASAFQGTHSRRFSGRSWSSPTNFAVSDLSGVPNVSTFNGPFVRLGLEPNMVGESEKHKFILVHFVGSMQPIFFMFYQLKQHFDSAFSCCYFPQPRWITPAVCTNFKPRRIWPCWANGQANGRVSWKMLKWVPFDKIWQKMTKYVTPGQLENCDTIEATSGEGILSAAVLFGNSHASTQQWL